MNQLSNCPVCGKEKMKTLKSYQRDSDGNVTYVSQRTVNFWEYAISSDEMVAEIYCSECGLLFTTQT